MCCCDGLPRRCFAPSVRRVRCRLPRRVFAVPRARLAGCPGRSRILSGLVCRRRVRSRHERACCVLWQACEAGKKPGKVTCAICKTNIRGAFKRTDRFVVLLPFRLPFSTRVVCRLCRIPLGDCCLSVARPRAVVLRGSPVFVLVCCIAAVRMSGRTCSAPNGSPAAGSVRSLPVVLSRWLTLGVRACCRADNTNLEAGTLSASLPSRSSVSRGLAAWTGYAPPDRQPAWLPRGRFAQRRTHPHNELTAVVVLLCSSADPTTAKMEPVRGFELVHAARWTLRCYVCGKVGACLEVRALCFSALPLVICVFLARARFRG